MNELLAIDELIMMAVILFASFWLFLFNYRTDNKEKYEGHGWLIGFDLIINMGMSLTGYLLISIVFTNVPQLAPYASYRYPVGFLFGLTSNVSIPIVLKWFQLQITKKLNQAGRGKQIMAQQDKTIVNGKDQKILQHDIEEIDKKSR